MLQTKLSGRRTEIWFNKAVLRTHQGGLFWRLSRPRPYFWEAQPGLRTPGFWPVQAWAGHMVTQRHPQVHISLNHSRTHLISHDHSAHTQQDSGKPGAVFLWHTLHFLPMSLSSSAMYLRKSRFKKPASPTSSDLGVTRMQSVMSAHEVVAFWWETAVWSHD